MGMNWIQYWRNSLIDADNGKGALNKKDLKTYYKTVLTDFSAGMLEQSNPVLNQIFSSEDNTIKVIKVHYRPVTYLVKKEHGQAYQGTIPQVLCPIICPVWVTRDGLFFSAGTPYIPRDVLSPQADDKFTVAEVSKLDDFLTLHDIPSYSEKEIVSIIESKVALEKQKNNWGHYYKFTQDLFKNVCSKNKVAELYALSGEGFIVKVDEVKGASTHILRLYDKLSETKYHLLYSSETVLNFV